jgi:asparagine synthase (glutamine-hydrolysing)
MCGLAGVVGPAENGLADPLARMLGALAHRGPDDDGTVTGPLGRAAVGLAHRRLSILDLSPAGHQPMGVPGTTLVFNGEIWNHADLRARLAAGGHRFVGTSDTETLLHWLAEYGPDGLAAVEGMYACAWVDHAAGHLYLARDPFGIKPLYVAPTATGLVFASEVRAVLASGLVPRRVDRAGLATLLAFGAVQAPHTIVEGVREFPAGHWGRYDPDRGLTVAAFFRYPDVRADVSPAEAVERVWELADRAVATHLMSDVPVGVLLSAGLDSQFIAATATRHSAALRSFTLGFEGQREGCEGEEAAAFAALYGLDHTPVWLGEQDCVGATAAWAGDLDQPSIDGLNVYIICGAVRRAGIKVVLSGLGGDEIFGGYPSFADAPRLRRLMRRVDWLPRFGRTALAGVLTARRGATVREKMRDILTGPSDLRSIYLQRRRLLPNRALHRLGFTPAPLGLGPDFQPPHPAGPPAPDDVAEISRLECRLYQGNMLLRDADATSMAHGLELRVPLLDQRLAEYALSLPGRVKLPHGRADKHLLRAVLDRKLGIRPPYKAKRGFVLPIARWLCGPLADLAAAGLDRIRAGGLLDRAEVERIWDGFRREPESPAWSRAFVLVVLGNYLERHQLS